MISERKRLTAPRVHLTDGQRVLRTFVGCPPRIRSLPLSRPSVSPRRAQLNTFINSLYVPHSLSHAAVNNISPGSSLTSFPWTELIRGAYDNGMVFRGLQWNARPF